MESGSNPQEQDRVVESQARRYRILVINGPNLNLLGMREIGIYGNSSLKDIEALCQDCGQHLDVVVECFQSNHEGALVDRIQEASGKSDLIIINPAAYTHTSVAIRDALLAAGLPVIEVHLSNVYRREPFRHHSYISDIAVGVVVGFGSDGYCSAIELGARHLHRIAATDPAAKRRGNDRVVERRPGLQHRRTPPRSVM